MESQDRTKQLFDTLVKKASLKQLVYNNTLSAFKLIKSGMEELSNKYNNLDSKDSKRIPFTFKDRSEFEAELKFAGHQRISTVTGCHGWSTGACEEHQ